ncbi:uncharacterized protein GIQ15_04844 [Arthroderma uncinatum]|uniref:uncharacterized protein n=1 Tax=Arthroderma uncinatum TaxID=74035 RepID=UPI00144AED1C|nr:uncharacterized protein GIQ15_04844 [Arthroderma uncinatum]KAF3482085.1 hypothetical protein GIQ15_04844 [Arthroderma uncinatum]
MASLLNLPNELLLFIFKELGDLDDVAHLERSCRHLHSLLEYGSHRLDIFRAVIINAEHHKYDVDLCYFIEANQAYASNYIDKLIPADDSRPRYSKFFEIYDEGVNTLTDEFVWWIACRWQGLRILQDLYLNSSINASFCRSVYTYNEHDTSCTHTCNRLAAEGPLHKPNVGPLTLNTVTSFSSRQTQRFYQALTAIWLPIEALVLARVSVYPTSDEQQIVFDYVTDIWEGDGRGSLSESFDILETYDFVWRFLGRRIFPKVDDYTSWTRNRHFKAHGSSEVKAWDNFVKFTRQYLRPSSIIELLLLSAWNNGSWPSNKPYYLQQLGHADEALGVVEDDTGDPMSPYYSLADIEVGIRRKLRDCGRNSPPGLGEAFDNYREKWWTSDARGKVITWEEDEAFIINRITVGLKRTQPQP